MRKAWLPLIVAALALLIVSTTSAKPSQPPPVAGPGLISWALGWRSQAVDALARLNAVRAAYGLPKKHHDFTAPAKTAAGYLWAAAGREWKREARRWNAQYRALWHQMNDPGGSGAARWRPLIRYYWPASLVDRAVWVVSRESGGRPTARNASGAAGLFQLLPAPDHWWEPAINVRKAYIKYRSAGGWSPWVVCR